MTKTETKQNFTLVQAFAMWQREGKKGTFLGGLDKDNNIGLIGFYNGNKKNPKEPDARIYVVDADGKKEKDECASLWLNVGKNGNQYLTGYYNEKKVVGFINKNGDSKQPYIRVYYREDKPVETENTTKAPF